MKQYVMKQSKRLLSLQGAVVTDVTILNDTIRLEFENGIEDRFKQRAEWTSRAVVTIPRIDWNQSTLTRFEDKTYEMLSMKTVRDIVKQGRLEIVGELYGPNRLLWSCMWMTDTAYLTMELSIYFTGDLIVQWESAEVEGLVF